MMGHLAIEKRQWARRRFPGLVAHAHWTLHKRLVELFALGVIENLKAESP